MNFYDVLAAEKLGGGIPTTNFFDLLFAQFISGEKWEIYEGTLPATLNANGDDMRQYQVWGNTGGVGDRTVNIYNTAETMWSADGTILDDNGNPTASSSHYTTNFTTVKPETTYYLSGAYRVGISTTRIYFYSESKSWISRSAQIDTVTTRVFTTPANCNFIQIQVANQLSSTAEWYIKEGTSPPETYVPYGYEVDMSVASPNMINVEPFKIDKQQVSIYVSLYNGKLKSGTYTVANLQENSITGNLRNTLTVRIGTSEIFENATTNYHTNLGWHYLTFTVSSEQSDLTTSIRFWGNNLNEDCNYSNVMLLNGSVRPREFIPYFNTTTPIYIGSDPLDKDEYVDYQSQKVYRMINGILTPTDPPVPLPALPTVDGTTIVDYAGSGAAPEKVYFEYKGGKQP